jgi:hypothetical protein
VSRDKRPIVPAPKQRVRYPRVGVVWGAFAAGTLSGLVTPAIARADCALPEHKGAVDPGGKATGKKGTKTMPVAVNEHPPLPGRMVAPHPPRPQALGGEPMPVQPPGQAVSPKPPTPPPLPREPLGGVEAPVAPVAPQGGPASVAPPQPKPHPLGGKPMAPKPPKPDHLDGDQAHVGRPIYIHPHGPDEPCLPPGLNTGRLIIKFS